MTADELKKQVVEQFDSASLTRSLELEASDFSELPRFFEVSHLKMRIALNDQTAVAAASKILAGIKRDIQQQGVELDCAIAVQWKVSSFSADLVKPGKPGRLSICETFHVELQSRSTKRLVGIRLSEDAIHLIREHLSHIPIHAQQSTVRKLVEACLNQQLASTGFDYWDPVLYPTRTIQAREISLALERCRQSKDAESQPRRSKPLAVS